MESPQTALMPAPRCKFGGFAVPPLVSVVHQKDSQSSGQAVIGVVGIYHKEWYKRKATGSSTRGRVQRSIMHTVSSGPPLQGDQSATSPAPRCDSTREVPPSSPDPLGVQCLYWAPSPEHGCPQSPASQEGQLTLYDPGPSP